MGYMEDMEKERLERRLKEMQERRAMFWLFGLIVAGIFLVIVSVGSFGTVDPGHRGVLVTMGKVDPAALPEGFYNKMPLFQSVYEINIQTQKMSGKTEAASKDLQVVTTECALNYHLEASSVPRLYAEIGIDYAARVIEPAIEESLKASTAHYTAEELVTRRSEAKLMTLDLLKARLAPRGIVAEELSITDFKFSHSFDQAIEAKVTAEQLKLKADRDLERMRTEAQQAEAVAIGAKNASIAKAQGEAEAIKIVSEQLKVSPQYIEWVKASRWNGELPRVSSSAVPFLNLGDMK